MKRVAIAIFLIGLFSSVFAQKIEVNQTDQKVDKILRTGLSVILELDSKGVADLWRKQLKDYGKVEKSGDLYIINIASVPSISSKNIRIISKVESSGKGTLVWWAIDLGDTYVTRNDREYNSAEKILRDFAVNAYKTDIEEQIKDAEKALAKTVKDQEKTTKQGESLVSDLDKNAKNKEKLEKDLENNAKEKIQLEKDIESNKKDQAAMEKEVEKMKKAVDVVKNKMNQIK